MPKTTWCESRKKPDPVRVMVKTALQRSDMTQAVLADSLGMTRQGVSYALKNPGSLTVDKLRKIARITGMKLVIRMEEVQ